MLLIPWKDKELCFHLVVLGCVLSNIVTSTECRSNHFGQNALRGVSVFEKCNLGGAWVTAHTYNVKISMQYIFMLYRQGRSYLSKFALWVVHPLWIRQREKHDWWQSGEQVMLGSMFCPKRLGLRPVRLRKEDLNHGYPMIFWAGSMFSLAFMKG